MEINLTKEIVCREKFLAPKALVFLAKVMTTVCRLPKSSAADLILVSAPRIKKLNYRYRQKNKATDVLSFPATRKDFILPAAERYYLGEVYICYSVLKRQAAAYHTGRQAEFIRLAVHGILHLHGYDHEVGKAEATRMFEKEAQVFKKLAVNIYDRL